MQNFVSSLQGELLESSFDYYREHGRRLRRKRARPANSSTAVSINSSGQPERNGTGTPHVSLNNAALNVRYEFKAATFAEFRAEIEVALKHYEDCYSALLDLFVNPVSPTNPHPFILARTKRWAEARVLADCLVVKICKMYLYSGNAEYASLTYNDHIRRLFYISADKWGIDKSSFEYWSWESKQHRIFGDLVEAAMASGFQIPPVPGPTPGPPLQARAAAQHAPAQVLQHPGSYYLKAGLAAEKRRELFRSAMENYERSYTQAMTDAKVEEPPKMSAALAHEKGAPHGDQIIELYTRAYDHYKRAKGMRMTLNLAFLIARVHYASEASDTALRFDERIGKTYRRERWSSILDCILDRQAGALRKQISRLAEEEEQPFRSQADESDQRSLKSKNIGDLVRQVVVICMERLSMAQDNSVEGVGNATVERILQPVASLQTYFARESASMPSVLELSSADTRIPIEFTSVFWIGTADLGSFVPFQISFNPTALAGVASEAIRFRTIEIHFSDERSPIVIQDDLKSSEYVASTEAASDTTANLAKVLSHGAIVGTLTCAQAKTLAVRLLL